jgi:hypothetical protein
MPPGSARTGGGRPRALGASAQALQVPSSPGRRWSKGSLRVAGVVNMKGKRTWQARGSGADR